MVIAGLVLTGVAALIHVYIFYLESIAWTSKRARATFGTSVEETGSTKELAFNQGFYNLFLALSVAAGLFFWGFGTHTVGSTLIFVGAGSMVAASVVLFIFSADKRPAALKQGGIPAPGTLFLALGLAI